jgi:CBS domain-containing protein
VREAVELGGVLIWLNASGHAVEIQILCSDLAGWLAMRIDSLLKAMVRDVVVLPPAATVAEAARLLAQEHIQIVVICDERRKIVGVVTDSDILREVGRCGSPPGVCACAIEGLMTRDVVTCRRGDPVERVLSIMRERGLRRVPVVDDADALFGLVTMRDALLYLYEEAKLDSEALKEYFLGIGYH